MNPQTKQKQKKYRRVFFYTVLGATFAFLIICLGIIGYHTKIHCSLDNSDGLTFKTCSDESVLACDQAPACRVDMHIPSKSDGSVVCPWRQKTSTLGLISILISLTFLGLFIMNLNNNSLKNLANFFALAFFASAGLLTTFILMVIDMTDGREEVEKYIGEGTIFMDSFKKMETSIIQSSYCANVVFIFFSFLLITSLTIYKIIITLQASKKQEEGGQRQVEVEKKQNVPSVAIEVAGKQNIQPVSVEVPEKQNARSVSVEVSEKHNIPPAVEVPEKQKPNEVAAKEVTEEVTKEVTKEVVK